MFAVYKATGVKSEEAYYGYATVVKDDSEILARFVETAKNNSSLESPKGSAKLFQLNDEDAELIRIEIVDVTDDEITAFTLRNDLRSQYSDSITAPTFMPWGIAQRAEKLDPERSKKWRHAAKCKDAKTAREAWRLGKWADAAVKALCSKFDKKSVVQDLDAMNPAAFELKYSL